jgi:hypothetical protein
MGGGGGGGKEDGEERTNPFVPRNEKSVIYTAIRLALASSLFFIGERLSRGARINLHP